MFDVLDLLSWDGSLNVAKLLTNLRSRLLGFQVERLNAISALDRTRAFSDKVHSIVDNVSSNELINLLLCPEMFHRISLSRDNGVAPVSFLLDRFISFKNFNDRKMGNERFGLWSPLGDKFIPNSVEYVDPWLGLDWLNDHSKFFQAYRTDNNIVVDTTSPMARREIYSSNFRPSFSPVVELTTKQKNDVYEKINIAQRVLLKNSPSAFELYDGLIYTIFPRADSSIEGFQGGSTREYMGRVNIINPQNGLANEYNVLSTLVHEAIHTLLYIREIWKRPKNHQGLLFSPNLKSPWTAQPIHLLAFVHASFVWYGLYKLWKTLDSNRVKGGIVHSYFINKAEKGFSSSKYLDLVKLSTSCYDQDLTDQLSLIPNRL